MWQIQWENLNECIFNSLSTTTKENPKKIWKALKSLTKSQNSVKVKGRWYLWEGHVCNGEHVKWVFCTVIIAQELKQSQTSSVSFDSSKLEEFVSLTVDNFVSQFNIPLITVQETQKFFDNFWLKRMKLVWKFWSWSHPFLYIHWRGWSICLYRVAVFQLNEKWRASHLSSKMAPKTVGTILDRSLCSPYCLKSVRSMLLSPSWITSWKLAYCMNFNQLFAQGTPLSPLWSV